MDKAFIVVVDLPECLTPHEAETIVAQSIANGLDSLGIPGNVMAEQIVKIAVEP